MRRSLETKLGIPGQEKPDRTLRRLSRESTSDSTSYHLLFAIYYLLL